MYITFLKMGVHTVGIHIHTFRNPPFIMLPFFLPTPNKRRHYYVWLSISLNINVRISSVLYHIFSLTQQLSKALDVASSRIYFRERSQNGIFTTAEWVSPQKYHKLQMSGQMLNMKKSNSWPHKKITVALRRIFSPPHHSQGHWNDQQQKLL